MSAAESPNSEPAERILPEIVETQRLMLRRWRPHEAPLLSAVVGGSGLHRRSGPGTLDVGYWIHVDHLRQGFATEITFGLMHAAFAIEGIDVVHVQTDEANAASAAVPAKLGFSPSAIIEGEPEAPGESGRTIDWTMTREAWNASP